MSRVRQGSSAVLALAVAWLWLASAAGAERVSGRVLDAGGAPLAGVSVTVEWGEPAHRVSVFSDEAGAFRTPELAAHAPYRLRARRIGWQDAEATLSKGPATLVLARHGDPAAVAAQLPAHHWWSLVVERFEDDELRHRLKRECTYCHQQGNEWTRRPRPAEQWQKLIVAMERRGSRLTAALHERLADELVAAYAPEHAVPRLTQGWQDAESFAPAPPAEVRAAVIEEWDLGSRASMQHDVIVHPDGRLYSVDGSQDQLHRLDPEAADGARRAWPVPQGDLPVGGIFGQARSPVSQTAVARVGPHSLQVAPDGSVWITLAIGNQLARFDPASEAFEIHEVAKGYYPHTLRFDRQGRIWYTMAASNHVGMLEPGTGKQRSVRLPARTTGQAVALRLMPMLMWLDRQIDLRSRSSESGDGFTMPVPYGIDIAPDGGVWFSQLNENRIGRIDPETLDVELFETPFRAPRRLRFDRHGTLWVPSFSAASIHAFDPQRGSYRSFELPTRPLLGEVPYALAVHPLTDEVWVCGTNSDTLMRFDPKTESFTVFPLPTRVTYTRDIDFDHLGRVWTSNSNAPAWQIEGGQPRVLRLDPDPERTAAVARRAAALE